MKCGLVTMLNIPSELVFHQNSLISQYLQKVTKIYYMLTIAKWEEHQQDNY